LQQFLTTEKDTVYLIHQSAKEHLEKDLENLNENQKSNLQPGGTVQGHVDITERSIGAMRSIIKRDIYGLRHWGIKSEDIAPPDPDPLAHIQSSCVFWLDHLRDAINESSESRSELYGLGFEFLKKHFLHWLESLSLLHKLSDRIISIKTLLNIVQVCLYTCFHPLY
jgi:hypothetical protein